MSRLEFCPLECQGGIQIVESYLARRAVLCPWLSASRCLPAFRSGPSPVKRTSARLPQAWFILRGSAENGGAFGSPKVRYGVPPASVRRLSNEFPRRAQSVLLLQQRSPRGVLIVDNSLPDNPKYRHPRCPNGCLQ